MQTPNGDRLDLNNLFRIIFDYAWARGIFYVPIEYVYAQLLSDTALQNALRAQKLNPTPLAQGMLETSDSYINTSIVSFSTRPNAVQMGIASHKQFTSTPDMSGTVSNTDKILEQGRGGEFESHVVIEGMRYISRYIRGEQTCGRVPTATGLFEFLSVCAVDVNPELLADAGLGNTAQQPMAKTISLVAAAPIVLSVIQMIQLKSGGRPAQG